MESANAQWDLEGPRQGRRAPFDTLYASASKSLWRPKPLEGPTAEFLWPGADAGSTRGCSSFAPSLGTPCESTAPSEGIWPSPSSAPLDPTPYGADSVATAAGQPPAEAPPSSSNDTAVEVHLLSPVAASNCEDDASEDPESLMLPPAANPCSSSSSSSSSSGVSPLVQFLRRAKVLKMSLTHTIELQQQSLQLLLLHPRVALAASNAPCCWCSAAADPKQQQQQQSCVVMLQIEMLQEMLQESSSQLQQQEEDLQRGEVLLCEEQQRELQQHEKLSSLLPHWQQQQKQAMAAAAAELRIRRSVLKHHHEQLQEALQQQQRLQQEARARWLVEAADEIRTCEATAAAAAAVQRSESIVQPYQQCSRAVCTAACVCISAYPEASDTEVVHLLQPQGGNDLWGCELSDGLIGNQLREKREKLLRLEESLRQLQHMVGLLQQQQQKRQQQQQQIEAVVTQTEKLTAVACTDLLVAHKYRKQSVKHTLLAAAAVVLLFLFLVLPHTSLGSFLAQLTD